MTARPDLAALARELIRVHEAQEEANEWDDETRSAFAALRDAVLSEPAAEADEPLQARQWREAFERAQDDVAALRAQLAAAKEEGASWRRVAEGLQTQLAAAAPDPDAPTVAELVADNTYITLDGAKAWARVRELETQLAAAAPLFEAAHAYERIRHRYPDGLTGTAVVWARSEAGQRWKKEHGS